ncbi:terminase large subunit domain-containing protein [Streptomyces andamanensis]|uniref:Terminase large subunit domain-containing protein n=1 Tax=Streptomyces andamanensis TaxID=1565035 RepID=A0ABV8TCG0_9ACTN
MSTTFADLTSTDTRAEAKRLAALTNPATMGRYLDPYGFQARAHTRLIGQELHGLGRDFDRLLLTTPPQVGKSTIVSELLPFWWLARHPSSHSAIVSYAASLALKKSRAARRHVIERGAQYGLYLQRGETSVHDWAVTSGGGLRATGVGGSLTGFPITGVGIVDDPHKDRRDADSLRMRNRVWEWWSSVFLSRMRPGVPAILVMTRWHEDDLAGRVLRHEGTTDKGGRWRVVHLPAIATHADDPLGREIGAPLTHPALEDHELAALLAHWEDKRRTSTPRDWGALYQGDPQPAEGALITRDQLADQRRLHGHPAVPPPERKAVAVDPSGGGRDVAGIIAGYRGTDQRLYITHDRSRACSSAQWSRRACLLAYETEATVIIVEKNFGGDMVNLAISTAWDALKKEGAIPADAVKPYVQLVHARTGKLLRAEPIAQQWLEDRIRTAAYLPEMEEEWATWQPDHTDSPGRIDASTYLAYGLLKVPGASQHLGNAAAVSLSQAAQHAGQGSGFGSIPLGRGGPGLPGSGR